ncbi:alanine racemase [Eubacteriales bacterium OttesenSCG-928-M02]|nr:alanine racemase [Eubacteriales bacterium OttesenSCG-928-M02]
MEHYRPTILEVDVFAFAHNVKALKAHLAADAKLMAVVKADAYGHGAQMLSRVALANGADCLGVAMVEEALPIRRYGIHDPILVLGATLGEPAYRRAAEEDIALAVYTLEQLLSCQKAAVETGKDVTIHLKVETGFHRLGMALTDIPGFLNTLTACPNVMLEGIFSHLGAADVQEEADACQAQHERLFRAEGMLQQAGYTPVVHLCNSAGTLRFSQYHRGMVRPGLSLYGYYPDVFLQEYGVSLKPVARLVSAIARIHTLGAGERIGYGFTHAAGADTLVATIPIGYADGYPRCQGNGGQVLVQGVRRPVIGRVCMDQIMVDISGMDVQMGEEVVLFGRQGDGEIPVEELAQRSGTIVHEILTGISARVYREYVYAG